MFTLPTRQSGARRRIVPALFLGVALVTALVGLPQASHAADFPTRPIRLVVGYTPGGSNDIVARIIAGPLGEALGTSVVVENRPGASGAMGADHVAKSAPDGYTLLAASASPVVITPHTLPKIPFDTLTDFRPINTVGLTPEAIAIGSRLKVKTLAELLALTRTQDVTLASSGNGGLPHLTIELLIQASRGRIVHVPYKGAAPAMADTIAGHVDGIVMDLPPLFPSIQQGTLKALAVTSQKRFEMLPDVPTAQEQLPGFEVTNWMGVFAPAKTPDAVVDQLNAALVKVVAREDVKAQLLKAAMVPSVMASPDAFRRFVAEEFKRWGALVKEKNISAAN
ncbi:MAG: tripartite tricarboxylate transporter substrate binding protein [Gammaproteobacteria bacterium]|nr:tripartite tricarboxylate transporter substrate binding protein [Gammaproteobacteria bacterium]MBU1440200.1 tripartite tricarboxylate transporter substrate binding protein [Gammaproteobacteria bacterium]MBU2285235.1 tripartite tricarboxylate transporter substrate binding protein [Gammaproteobacteria bacterium]